MAIAATVAATLAACATERSTPLARAELRAISSRLEARLSTVLIEASEPVAYVTSQPDPLTVLVDLRNVQAGVLRAAGRAAAAGHRRRGRGRHRHRRRAAGARPRADGSPGRAQRAQLAQRDLRRSGSGGGARIAGARRRRLAKRSEGHEATTPVRRRPATAAAARRPRRAPPPHVHACKPLPNGVVAHRRRRARRVDGRTKPKDLPPRVLLDFHGVSARGVPAVTDVNQGDIQRVRVGAQQPLAARHPRRDRSRPSRWRIASNRPATNCACCSKRDRAHRRRSRQSPQRRRDG